MSHRREGPVYIRKLNIYTLRIARMETANRPTLYYIGQLNCSYIVILCILQFGGAQSRVNELRYTLTLAIVQLQGLVCQWFSYHREYRERERKRLQTMPRSATLQIFRFEQRQSRFRRDCFFIFLSFFLSFQLALFFLSILRPRSIHCRSFWALYIWASLLYWNTLSNSYCSSLAHVWSNKIVEKSKILLLIHYLCE